MCMKNRTLILSISDTLTHICMYVCMHACMYINVCVCVCVSVCVCVRILCVCLGACVYGVLCHRLLPTVPRVTDHRLQVKPREQRVVRVLRPGAVAALRAHDKAAAAAGTRGVLERLWGGIRWAFSSGTRGARGWYWLGYRGVPIGACRPIRGWLMTRLRGTGEAAPRRAVEARMARPHICTHCRMPMRLGPDADEAEHWPGGGGVRVGRRRRKAPTP